MKEMILAVTSDRKIIGQDNKLLVHNKDDLKLFKELTIEKNCIMGRKTFESILEVLGKPLPNRFNIVISTTLTHSPVSEFDKISGSNVSYISSLNFLEYSESLIKDNYIIIGGKTLYEYFIDEVDRVYLTVHNSDLKGDVQLSESFLEILENDFMITSKKRYDNFIFYIYSRKGN